jgi:molybdopterin synthase catalytic subunit
VAPAVRVTLGVESISLDALVAQVRGDGDGAVALFAGTVRDTNRGRRVIRLEYEAWPEMARDEMLRIAAEAGQRFALSAVGLAHRTGALAIGETSVAVAVSAPHRQAALEACRWLIDELKRRVPIWKKQLFEGGEVWIEGAGESPAGGGGSPFDPHS